MKIFISYEHNSWPLAQKLNEWLAKEHTVYWDFGQLYPGMPFNEKISSLISDSDFCILIASQTSLVSKWVASELAFAKALQKAIIPIKVEGVTNEEIEGLPFLGKVQVLDWPTNKNIQNEILETIKKYDYHDMLKIGPVERLTETILGVNLTNNSSIDLYDITLLASMKTYKDSTMKDFLTTKLVSDRVLKLNKWTRPSIDFSGFLSADEIDDAFKNENVRLAVLCKFTFQNQERFFSVYKEIELPKLKKGK